MLKFFKYVFSERGDVSCMRFMAFISLTVGSILALYSLYRGCDLNSTTPLVSVFVGAAFGGKVLQKHTELVNNNRTNKHGK